MNLLKTLVFLDTVTYITITQYLAHFGLHNYSVLAATYKIFVAPNRKAGILEALFGFMGPTEVQPGCQSCQVTQDLSDPEVIIYTEEWQSRDELENHVRSQRFHVLLTILDLSLRAPEIRIATVTQAWGMEFIESVRLGKSC